MKNELFIAASVLSTFTGVASAQTNVTIYGLLDTGMSRVHSGAGTRWGVDPNLKNSNRIGFRGTEDLGGGLNALFTLETGFSSDTGTLSQGGRIFGRQVFVGLGSQFGIVKFGRQYTPIHNVLSSIDPFQAAGTGNILGNGFIIGSTALTGATGQLFNSYGFGAGDPRMENAINYTTPKFGGFQSEMAYGFGEQAGSFSAGRQVGIAVNYAAGPLKASAAYHNAKPISAGTVSSNKGWALGGVYDLNVASVHVALQDDEAENATGVQTGKARNWMLATTVPIGAGKVRASWVRHDDRRATDVDIDQYAIGYYHALSKRTDLYTQFAYLKQRGNTIPALSTNANHFNVGIQHRF